VGKKTIGSILANHLHARFIHNHLLHDVAIVCTGFDDPDRWTLYESVRQAAYVSLRKRPRTEVFVMTNALCKNSPRELKAWRDVVELATFRNVPLVPIVLEAAADKIVRRLQSAERVGKKFTDPAELRSYFAVDELQYPAVSELLIVDVTNLEPEESATWIERHVNVIKGTLEPAGSRHLSLR
jgi:gluconate kinase